MKKLTVLEKRLKKAHEYRQNAFKRRKIYPVAPFGNQAEGQYALVRSEETLTGNEKAKVNLIKEWMSLKRSLQNIRWKPIGVRQIMFALALIAIILIILSSRF